MSASQTPCDVWAERLSAYLDNELTDDRRREVEEHLDRCPECAALRDALGRDRGLFRAVPEDVRASETFADTVMRDVAAGPQPASHVARRPGGKDSQLSVRRLMEALAVIAMVAVLTAILFPVFSRAREKARQSSCMSNLKQLALAMQMYANDYDGHLPMAWNWTDAVYPYYKNKQVLQCTAAERVPLPHYSMAASLSGAKLEDISDAANTVLLYEGKHGVADRRHNEGCNLAFADGHAKWVKDPSQYDLGGAGNVEALLTFPSGGMPAPKSGRKLAYSAQVTVEVGDAAQALYEAEAVIARHHGFVLNSGLQSDDDGTASAQITFRVPRPEFSSAVTEVSQLGGLRSRQVNGRDLTEQFVAVSHALERDQQTYASLKETRQRSQKTKDRLGVEDRLKDVRESGARRHAEKNAVLGQTELATVSAVFVETVPQKQPAKFTLQGAFRRPIRALGTTGKGLAVVSAWALVYLPVWGPIAGLVVWRRRVVARRGGW